MSLGPEVQKALYDAFTADPPVSGGRIFDRVPKDASFPYITIGDEQRIDDANSCDDGWEVYPDIHIWSRAVGRVEAKRLVADAEARIKAIAGIAGFTLISVSIETSRVFMDPDGLTAHGVVTAKFIITPA
jgi:hypothetical protein